MIAVNGGVFTQTVRPPKVYLDHWAIRHFSDEHVDGKRLLDLFASRGTLMFSPVNVLEIGANSGPSLQRICSFLRGIGDHWVQINSNPVNVMEREDSCVAQGVCPVLSARLVDYYPNARDGPLSLAVVVERMLEDFEMIQMIQRLSKRNWDDSLACFRQASAKAQDVDTMGKSIERRMRASGAPMGFVLNALLLLIVKEHSINENDAVDFFHAAPAIAYSDVALLDGRWADIARRVHDLGRRYGQAGTGRGLVRAFKKSQISDFFAELERSASA